METLQDVVSLPMVQRYVKKLDDGLTPPPIKVDGNVIVEGNHRYVAGRVYGKEPPSVPGVISPSQRDRIKPIKDIRVDPVDWGGH